MDLKDIQTIELENNKYIEKFCKNCDIDREELLHACEDRFFNYIIFAPDKIKIVKNYKHDGVPIYEFRVPVNHIADFQFVRVAYISREEKMIIFYVSKILHKATFVRELAKTTLVE